MLSELSEPFLKQTETLTELPENKIGFYDPRFVLNPYPVEFNFVLKNGVCMVEIPSCVLHPKHIPQFKKILDHAVSKAMENDMRGKSK